VRRCGPAWSRVATTTVGAQGQATEPQHPVTPAAEQSCSDGRTRTAKATGQLPQLSPPEGEETATAVRVRGPTKTLPFLGHVLFGDHPQRSGAAEAEERRRRWHTCPSAARRARPEGEETVTTVRVRGRMAPHPFWGGRQCSSETARSGAEQLLWEGCKGGGGQLPQLSPPEGEETTTAVGVLGRTKTLPSWGRPCTPVTTRSGAERQRHKHSKDSGALPQHSPVGPALGRRECNSSQGAGSNDPAGACSSETIRSGAELRRWKDEEGSWGQLPQVGVNPPARRRRDGNCSQGTWSKGATPLLGAGSARWRPPAAERTQLSGSSGRKAKAAWHLPSLAQPGGPCPKAKRQ
jgi:hypothetical protein